MPLTDSKIRDEKAGDKPKKLTDAGGLYLEVRPSGARLWRYRYRIAGKENVFALGEYGAPGKGEKFPSGNYTEEQRTEINRQIAKIAADRRAGGVFTLAEARIERERCRGLVKQGVHPSHERQAQVAAQVSENLNTFEGVARAWVEQKRIKWSPYYLKQVERALEQDAYPYIGRLPARAVTAAHLLAIIERMDNRGAPTLAILLRQWFSAIFRFAVRKQLADTDPASALKGAIERPKIQHSRALAKDAIPDFLAALKQYGGYRVTVIALRLLMLTFVRTVELRKAEWREFDLEAAQWTIPGERMKMRVPHIVPLSAQAIELLKELRTLTGGQDFLFPNLRSPKTCMTATTLNRALERMGYGGKFSAHGFRSTASTMLNELKYRSDVIERQLAHKERNAVRNAYNHAEYLPERVQMMQDWANLIDSLSNPATNVTPINSGMRAA